MSKRSKSKYPALEKGMNLKSRKDFIEVDYVNGVRNKNGEQVIRPLTDAEKKWLNQYYEETIVTNFLHHPELKKLNDKKKNIIQCKIVRQMQKQVTDLRTNSPDQEELIKEIKEMIRLTKEQNSEKYAHDIRNIEQEMQEVRDHVLLYPDKEDHKKFYNDNNKRNVCVYNQAKKTGTLLELDTEAYDTFVASHLDHVDCELAAIHDIEGDEDE